MARLFAVFLTTLIFTTGLVACLEPLSICEGAADSAAQYGSCGCPSNVQGGSGCKCGSTTQGFDAPGLIYRAYNDAGWTDIANDLANQYQQGGTCHKKCSPADTTECVVGDLFFSCKWGNCPDHVSIYIGNNQIAECSNSNTHCHITIPTITNYYGCRRMCSENATKALEPEEELTDEDDGEIIYEDDFGTGSARADFKDAESTSGGGSSSGANSQSTFSSSSTSSSAGRSTAASGRSTSSSGASTGSSSGGGSTSGGRGSRRPTSVEKGHSHSWSSHSSGARITYSSVSTIAEDDGRRRHEMKQRQRKVSTLNKNKKKN